jgi:hypothetical protein
LTGGSLLSGSGSSGETDTQVAPPSRERMTRVRGRLAAGVVTAPSNIAAA